MGNDLYTQFRAMMDSGMDPFSVADAMGLDEDSLIEFEIAYADEKLHQTAYDAIDTGDDDIDLGGS